MGTCSVIIARIWAILAAIFLLSAGCFYVYMRPSVDLNRGPLYHHNEESFDLTTSWPEFLEDCGGEQVIENFVHTKLVFNEKYENNVINWRGYVAEVRKKQQQIVWINDAHYIALLVKMEPSESPNYADLVLSVSTDMYNSDKAFYDGLAKGDGIDFEAKLVGLGNEFKIHHLHAKNINRNGT